MKDIRMLEELLDILDVDLTSKYIYNYEDYPAIRRYIKEFRALNPVIVENYIKENELEEYDDFDGINIEDILYIFQNQIETLKSVITKQLDLEYKSAIQKNKLETQKIK